MPSIPLTAQTHSWVSGEGCLGKNKVSFNREQCRAWETRWLCFSPTDEPVPQARSNHFQNTVNVEASLGCFVYTLVPPIFIVKKYWFIHGRADSIQHQSRHTWRISDTTTIRVQAITSESTHWQLTAVRATHITAHIYMGSWHDITVFNEKKNNILHYFCWTEKNLNCPHFFFLNNFYQVVTNALVYNLGVFQF